MIKIKLRLLNQLSSLDQGFSMAEVLIAILAAFAFLLGALQALSIQAVVKVRAEREAQATYWIQQDLESVKAAATDVADDTFISRCGVTTYFKGFAYKLRDNLFNNLDGGGNPLDASKPQYTSITASPSSNPNIQVVSTNLTLDDSSRPLNNNSQINNNSQTYRLVRIINPDTNNVNVLKITYRVGLPRTDTTEKTAANTLDYSVSKTKDPTPSIDKYDQLIDNTSGKTSIIAQQYVEVVPNAALTC